MIQDAKDRTGLASLIARTARQYDLLPYESHPIPQSHPNRTGAVAKLFGLEPAALANARVLELGCAAGGNLIPLAARHPGAVFVGVDLSRTQVAAGHARIERMGLRNIEIRCQSLTEIGRDLGQFDYIICHGVYSWVPDPVREDILRIGSENLAPGGVAYVSYNVLPGWRLLQVLRDAFLLGIPGQEDARQRVAKARELMACLKDAVSADGAYRQAVTEACRRFGGMSDDYLAHEFLEENNEPCTFKDFLDRARRHGLAYLGDVEVPSMILDNHPAETARRVRGLAGNGQVAIEQHLDLLTGRTFRQTLLVHAGRMAGINRNLGPECIGGMHFFTGAGLKLEHDGETSVLGDAEGRKLITRSPVVVEAMRVLLERFPASFSIDDLAGRLSPRYRTPEGRKLVQSAMFSMVRIGLAYPWLGPLTSLPEVSDKPVVCPLVRSDAESGARATANLRHEKTVLNPAARAAIKLMDGTRDQAALAGALGAEERVAKVLGECARASLLVG